MLHTCKPTALRRLRKKDCLHFKNNLDYTVPGQTRLYRKIRSQKSTTLKKKKKRLKTKMKVIGWE